MIDGLVSIIMPSWNTAKYITESIQSVINQTYTHWELLIVDDCSSDNTDEVVSSFQDDRIHYLKNKQNSGAALTRNRALREARGEWIAFLDSDDIWLPEKLEKQISFMRENGYVFSYHEYTKIDEHSKPLGVYVSGPKIVTKRKMYHYGYPGCLTFMYSAKRIGLIQIKNIKKNNDYAILLQLCKKANCYLLCENLAEYRIRKKSISHDKLSKKLKSHYDLFHYCDEKPVLIAVWYACWNMFWGVIKKKKYEKKVVDLKSKRDMTTIKDKLICAIRKNDYLFFIIKYWRLRFLMVFTKFEPDKKYICRQYRKKTGKTLNLSAPVLYNEKVQYAKLHYHDLRLKQLVDKYAVRKYVEEKIGKRYLTKLYGVYDKVSKIPFNELPNQFVMKLTNGSGFNYICKNKTPKEIRKIKRRFKKWLKLDFYMLGREWAYKNVPNRIICEEYLETKDILGLNDYKVFCFNGTPKLIQVDFSRFSNHKRNLYTTEWEFLDEQIAYPNDSNAPIKKPENLFEMLDCASKLSEGFPHVRVDFYNIDNHLVFGEMTFYHGAGYLHFENEEFEKKLGSYWKI